MSGKYDMTISQGSDFLLNVTIKDSAGALVDLTGHTFSGQIRKTASDATVQASFTFNILNQGTNPGEVEVKLDAALSTAIILEKSKNASRKVTTMTYDVESVNGGTTVRWLEGLAKISPEVTK